MYKILLALFLVSTSLTAQEEDAFFIKKIYDNTLSQGQCYDWLYTLATETRGRIAGSPASDSAMAYTARTLRDMGVDTVKLQPCTVDYWYRGEAEKVTISTLGQTHTLPALALGNSIATPPSGLSADIIEVHSLDEVDSLGQEAIQGKIVFYNRPMDPTMINTFHAYGSAVDQRVWGASKAAEYGAVAVMVRSMGLRQDDHPHTGTLYYKPDQPQIPAVAISTNAANKLAHLLTQAPVTGYVRTDCRSLGERPSYNIIGEIKGSTHPDEIIVVGGHLDSWDVAGGAHDDGAGCVHAMQVVQNFLDLDYQPKRTIRCVLFSNEENGLAGGRAYAEASNAAGEFHLFALESDAGGFTPRGFHFDADTSVFKTQFAKVYKWLPLLEPYGLFLSKGGSGADIGPLKSQKGLLAGLRPDSQRYFDYHHTAIDNIEAVNRRELELGAAAMTSLIYLIDQHGLD